MERQCYHFIRLNLPEWQYFSAEGWHGVRVFIYPGSFDPLTNGHLDIIRRASGLCDRLIVAVMVNSDKKPAFTAQERMAMIRDVLAEEPGHIEVVSFTGLLVNLYHDQKANAVVRGLRSESDFRFEAEMAAANKLMLPTYETCLLPCRLDLTFISSSIVREVASYGGDVRNMVPAVIAERVMRQLRRKQVESSSLNAPEVTN